MLAATKTWGGGGLATPMLYRAKSVRNGSSASTAPKPAGIAVGDAVFVVKPADEALMTLTTASGDLWSAVSITTVNGSYKYNIFYKILNATDVANAWNLSAASSYIASFAYEGRGARTITLKQTVDNAPSQSTLVFTGFAPGLEHKGLVSFLVNRDTDAADTVPTNFVSREAAVYNTFWRFTAADHLTGYPGGGVTWTGVNGTGSATETGFLFEVTGL